eukprot:scaffold4756_cov116-Isochrysis_galbana.AAC.18
MIPTAPPDRQADVHAVRAAGARQASVSQCGVQSHPAQPLQAGVARQLAHRVADDKDGTKKKHAEAKGDGEAHVHGKPAVDKVVRVGTVGEPHRLKRLRREDDEKRHLKHRQEVLKPKAALPLAKVLGGARQRPLACPDLGEVGPDLDHIVDEDDEREERLLER